MARTGWRVANAGGYPRIGDAPGQQRLRRTHDHVDKGAKTEADLRAAQDDAVREAVREQIEAGCDLVTDGLIRYPGMLDLPVDNFDLELSNSELDLIDLFRRHPFTKDLSFGAGGRP